MERVEVPKAKSVFVKFAAIQFASRLGEVEYNRSGLAKLCVEAQRNGAKFIVLPETSITGYISQDLKTNWRLPGRELASKFENTLHPSQYAETIEGPSVLFFKELSARLKVYITVPFLESSPSTTLETDTHYFNSVCVVCPEGKVVAHYRKMNPWPVPEQSWATPGESIVTFETEYGKLGVAICFDIHNILALYAKEQIWALLYPIAWVGDVNEWFRKILPKNLAKCEVPFNIVGANWSVDSFDESWRGFGYSTIYGPGGMIYGGSGSYEGSDIVYAQIPTNNHTKLKFKYETYKLWKFLEKLEH